MTALSHTFALTTKAQKLLTLCEHEGVENALDLARKGMNGDFASICMVEGCSHIEYLEGDQREGWCSECQSNTMVSALVLLDLI
jgi:hypothetical protein